MAFLCENHGGSSLLYHLYLTAWATEMPVCGFSDHPLSSGFENGAMVPMLRSSGIKTKLSSRL